MYFIITRFLRMIVRDYGYTYEIISSNGKFVCIITGIPFELRTELENLRYSHVMGQRDIYDKKGNFLRTEVLSEEFPICGIVFNPVTNSHDIKVIFDDDTYAEKCNKIEYTIRRYYENHSLIDAINRKG